MTDITKLSNQELFDSYYNKSWQLVKMIKELSTGDFYIPEEIINLADEMVAINDQRLTLD